MKESKFKRRLIKIIASVLCIVILSHAMPKKSHAFLGTLAIIGGTAAVTYFGGKKVVKSIATEAAKAVGSIVDDFVNLLLAIPDGIVGLMDDYIVGSPYTFRYDISSGDKPNRVYNFKITPYAIFTSGTYVEDPFVPGRYITEIGFFDINFFNTDVVRSANVNAPVSSNILAPTISKVYNNIRNLCIIVMMLVLLYIGIKMMLSSIAEQQAKYKQMLIDWLVAFSLMFVMHYIMSFIVNINSIVINMIKNDEGDSYYILANTTPTTDDKTNDIYDRSIILWEDTDYEEQLGYVINLNETTSSRIQEIDYGDDIDNLVNNSTYYSDEQKEEIKEELHNQEGSLEIDLSQWGNNGVVPINAMLPGKNQKAIGIGPRVNFLDEDDFDDAIEEGTGAPAGTVIYKLNTMSYVRTVAYQTLRVNSIYLVGNGILKSADSGDEMGYTILYVVLMIETVMFAVIYTKRLFQLAFLTMVAPLVALMYPIDKLGDGKAQAFNTWFKDYLFGVLIQPMHLILYTVFIRGAGSMLNKNLLFALAMYAYMIPAEKYFKKLLGFEKSTGMGSGGPIAGALGAGLAMGGLNKLAGIGPGGKGGGGKAKADPRKHKIPKAKFPAGSTGTATTGRGGVGTGGTPSSSGGILSRLRGGRSGLTPSAGAAAQKRSLRERARGSVPASAARALGRGVIRGATGGKYENLSRGALGTAGINVGGKLVRGGARVLGAAGLGTAGFIAGTASAIVNGNPMDIVKGTTVGALAGNKQAGALAGMVTGDVGGFFDDVIHERASSNPEYAMSLRQKEAFQQFSSDLADLSHSDRQKYSEVIREMSPYVDFGSFDEVKAMYNAKEQVGEYSQKTIDTFKAAKSWGDLKNIESQNSYFNFIDKDVREGIQNGSIHVADSDIQTQLNESIEALRKQKEKQIKETEAEYDRLYNKARNATRRQDIKDEYENTLQQLRNSVNPTNDEINALKEEAKVNFVKHKKLQEVLAAQEDLKK